MILILALSFISLLPALTSPAHAFTCPTSSASGKIEGCVVNRDNNNPVPNQYVVIITCGGYQITDYAITDSNGHFSFAETLPNGSACIIANKAYIISVNGATPVTSVDGCYPLPSPCKVLGNDAYDRTWGQWAGDVTTDNNGYASMTIGVSPAQRVWVTAAAMYSDTQFTTLHFSMSQSSDVTIGVSASIGGASSVQAGYSYSFGVTSTNSFDEPVNHSDLFAYPYYAIGYYCAGSTSESFYGWTCSQGLKSAGVTDPIPGYHWQPYTRGEYLNPNSLSGPYLDCTIIPSAAPFGPSSTHTAGQTSSLGFTSGATFFGITASFSYTTTYSSTTSDTTGVTISYTNGPNLTFRYYPATGTCQNPIFGSELHVWDMSPPPDYSLSASPSSISAQTGSSWSRQSTINVQASWGWALPVGLTAGSDDPNLSLSLNPTNVNPMGGSAQSTLTVTDLTPSDCGSYTITVQGSTQTAGRFVQLPVTISPIDFCVFTNKSIVDVAHSQGDCATISVMSNAASTVSLSASLPPGFSAIFGQPNLSVSAGGTSSTWLCFSVPGSQNAGTYSATIVATAGSVSHSVPVSINYVGDYSLAVSSLSVYASPGSSASLGLAAYSYYGFSGNIWFSTFSSGGITASIYSNPMLLLSSYGYSTTTMSISIPSTTPVGTYTLTIQGMNFPGHGGVITQTVTVTINVSAPCSGCGGGGGGGGGGPPRPMITKSIN